MFRLFLLILIACASSFAQTTLRLHADLQVFGGYRIMDTNPGTGTVSSITATAPGPGKIQLTDVAGGTALAWVSPPVAVPVKLVNSITCTIWGKESKNSANAGYYVAIAVYRNGVQLSDFTMGGPTDELPTGVRRRVVVVTSGSNPTLQVGDRIVVRWYLKDSGGVMTGGQKVATDYNGKVPAADGDSFVQFIDPIVFSL